MCHRDGSLVTPVCLGLSTKPSLCHVRHHYAIKAKEQIGVRTKMFPVSAVFVGIIVFILNLVAISYSIIHNDVDWSGFAIDGQGLLYIACTGKIDVIREGKKLRELKAPTSRGFVFTIEKDDTILLMTGTALYKLDLNGNILEKTGYDQDLHNRIVRESSRYTAKDGLTYHMSSPWGRMQIAAIKDGKETVVYQMPVNAYLMRIFFVMSIAGLGYVLYAVFRWKYGHVS